MTESKIEVKNTEAKKTLPAKLVQDFKTIESEVTALKLNRANFDELAKAILAGKSEQMIIVGEQVYRLSSTGKNCRIDKQDVIS